jgi:hypothetical protein
LTAEGTSERPQHEVPYLHVRAPQRIVGVGGEGDPVAKVYGNRAGLLALREQLDRALAAEEGLASQAAYREADERRLDLFVRRAHRRSQMGEPREPERPDRSVFA